MLTRAAVLKILDDHLPPTARPEINAIIKAVEAKLPEPHLPGHGETAAVASFARKTAALFYDRVWNPSGSEMPEEIRFSAQTEFEVASVLVGAIFSQLVRQHLLDTEFLEVRNALKSALLSSAMINAPHDFASSMNRAIAESLSAQHGLAVVPIFESQAAREREFKSGDFGVVIATLYDLRIPVEEQLEWSQVVELRRDPQSKSRVRRLNHWLEAEMIGKPWSFVQDEIAIRLENYEDALRKHGVQTVLGSLSAMLDNQLLIGGSVTTAAVSYVVDPLWGLAAGGAVILGKAAVHIARALVDRREVRHRYPEIAFVAEIKKAAIAP